MFARFAFLLSLVALLGVTSTAALAQDVIIDLSGNELTGQVVEITPTQVLYRAADTDPSLPPTVLDRKTLFMVRFANGTKEVFGSPGTPAVETVPEDPNTSSNATSGAPPLPASPTGLTFAQHEELRWQGVSDGRRYGKQMGPFLGTMLGTAGTFGTVVPAVVIAVVRPKAAKNPQLDPKLLVYPSYVQAYETTARKRKLVPVIGGYLSGLLLLGFILAASAP